jgi:polyphosphate kinase
MSQTSVLIAPHETDKLLFDRELSWLSFNERVLATAHDETIPLGEQLRFVSISSDNLDEFYMVRLAGMLQLSARGFRTLPETDDRLDEALKRTSDAANHLRRQQDDGLAIILKKLSSSGLTLLSPDQMSEDEQDWLHIWYSENILPLLAPTTLDPAHPFPFIHNRGKGVLIDMLTHDETAVRAVILMPENLDRFIQLPGAVPRFVAVEAAILEFIDLIYPGYQVEACGMFRVLRDSEMEIDDEAEDLVSQFENALRARRRGDVVSLVLSETLAGSAKTFLMREMSLTQDQIYIASGYVGIGDFSQIIGTLPKSELYSPFTARFPQRVLDFKGDCFAAIRNKDILVHHPYESFDVVVRFLQQAAADPNVLAIRQTLYRTTPKSPIAIALIAAAEAGKSVTAIIELKARFDEENNIQLARSLERAGAHVAYGLGDLKVHSKLSMVVRREEGKLVSYTHCGTGNYHPQTAKTYTDLSFFTCDKDICEDVWRVFNFLTSHVQPKDLKKLVISPHDSHRFLMNMIDKEIANAKAGRPSGVLIKCNAIVDEQLIKKFYEASQAGVKIHLIVRGICCLRPNVKGLSETITVTSIVGRYLEHGRIYVFANGGEMMGSENLIYMASADLMPRNLFYRVETFIPLENETVRAQALEQVMGAGLRDTLNSWTLNSDGSYSKVESGATPFSSHHYFMKNPSLSGQGSLADNILKK